MGAGTDGLAGLAGMFQYDFMIRALSAGVLVGLLAPVVGTFLVLRRLSLLGDALAHVALAGLAGGLWLGVYPTGAALGLAVAAGGAMEALRARYRRHGELAVAVTLSTAVALAAVFFSLGGAGGVDLFAYLFGSVLTVSGADVRLIGWLTLAVLAVVAAFYRDLLAVTLDEELARVAGLPVGALNLLFTMMAAAAVAASMRVVGVLLVSSLMVLPVAASLQVARSFRGALVLAVLFAQAAVVLGLVTSYWMNLPPGATVVLAAVVLLLGALGLRRLRPDLGPA
ncbi:metal ABC transporter permease [Thermaerobacter litoralis]